MIGQERLLKTIDKLVENGFPRFAIFCGPKNSGKKLISRYIASKLNAPLVTVGIKVDDIREVISLSYKQSQPTVYLIPDADKMSLAARNALLKVTEEPPRKAYFIMTLLDIGNTLATLKSRGMVFNIEPYSPKELMEYCTLKKYEIDNKERFIVCNLCAVPGEVDILIEYDIKAFYKFVELVIENIGKVSGANAFKIGQKLKYKDEDNGWDITLFMRALMFNYLALCQKEPQRAFESILIVSKYLAQMNTTGINKSATIDMLILELRGIWVEE